MNDTHKRQIDYELKEGRVKIITEEGFACSNYEYIAPTSITEIITQGLIKEYEDF
jgi:hypothetical protein